MMLQNVSEIWRATGMQCFEYRACGEFELYAPLSQLSCSRSALEVEENGERETKHSKN